MKKIIKIIFILLVISLCSCNEQPIARVTSIAPNAKLELMYDYLSEKLSKDKELKVNKNLCYSAFFNMDTCLSILMGLSSIGKVAVLVPYSYKDIAQEIGSLENVQLFVSDSFPLLLDQCAKHSRRSDKEQVDEANNCLKSYLSRFDYDTIAIERYSNVALKRLIKINLKNEYYMPLVMAYIEEHNQQLLPFNILMRDFEKNHPGYDLYITIGNDYLCYCAQELGHVAILYNDRYIKTVIRLDKLFDIEPCVYRPLSIE